MDKDEEIRRLYELVRAYQEMSENQGEYIEYLETKVQDLCRWQKTIIDLHEKKNEGLAGIMQDIEEYGKLSKDERERFIAERHRENLNIRKRRKSGK